MEETVIDILGKIDVDIESDLIEACHRVGKKGKTIVKFSRRKDVSKIFTVKKNLKHLDPNTLNFPENTKIYINESLCNEYRSLWFKCKKLWMNKLISKFWTVNGMLKIKKTALGNPSSITHLFDLQSEFPEVNFETL